MLTLVRIRKGMLIFFLLCFHSNRRQHAKFHLERNSRISGRVYCTQCTPLHTPPGISSQDRCFLNLQQQMEFHSGKERAVWLLGLVQ